MIGTTANLHRLRSMLEAGRPYQTMGHTLWCQYAFPMRWKDDYGPDSRAQLACNAWNQFSYASAETLLVEEASGWTILDEMAGACVLQNFKSGDTVEGRSDRPALALLIAMLKGLILEREKADGVKCVSCDAPAVRSCDVDCGDATCNCPLCATCWHQDMPYSWRHKESV